MNSLVAASGARPKKKALDKCHTSEETHQEAMKAVNALKFEKVKEPRSYFTTSPSTVSLLTHQS